MVRYKWKQYVKTYSFDGNFTPPPPSPKHRPFLAILVEEGIDLVLIYIFHGVSTEEIAGSIVEELATKYKEEVEAIITLVKGCDEVLSR